MMVSCGVCSIFSIIMAQTTNIWLAYVISIAFSGLMYFSIALSAAQIATRFFLFFSLFFSLFFFLFSFLCVFKKKKKKKNRMTNDLFAFVFGVNTFFALVLQTIIQIICGSSGLNVSIQARFSIYCVSLFFFLFFFSFFPFIFSKNNIAAPQPEITPWYSHFRDSVFKTVRPSEHEYFDHPIACKLKKEEKEKKRKEKKKEMGKWKWRNEIK